MASPGKIVGSVVFSLCGPIGSLCCFVLSLWGLIMLFLLGVFYYIEAAVLFEDIKDALTTSETGPISDVKYYNTTDVTRAYHNAAISCWGAAFIYLLFVALSGTFIGVNIWRKKQQ